MAASTVIGAKSTASPRNRVLSRWMGASLIAQIALATYFQAINWIPMGRWNFQPDAQPLAVQSAHGQLAVADLGYVLLFLLPVTLYLLAVWQNWSWLMWIGLVGYSVWLGLEVVGWWIPYAFGASDTWMVTYQRVFSQSTQLLPSVGRHLAPDGLHLVLSLLLVAVVATIAVDRSRAMLRLRRMVRPVG